jgi:glycosyltransferase involved in cell wall biosynthesis
MPHPHKGLTELIAALNQESCSFMHLELAGTSDAQLFKDAKRVLGNRCPLLGMVDNGAMHSLLSTVDIVPVLQHDTAIARAQLPAKAVEAMSAGRAVIATAVGDLPELLGAGTSAPRGWIVPNTVDSSKLATLLATVARDVEGSRNRCTQAQTYARQIAHPTSIAHQLEQ